MKILQANQFYYERGGADKYFLEISARLQAAGHEVAVFSMRHPKNLPSPFEKYFVSRISFNESRLRDYLLAPGRMIYSLEAQRRFKRLVRDFKPDIIHIHNIYHHLSPSILPVAKEFGIPVVMHVHDYKLICPNHQLFTEGQVCERCRGGHYYEALKHRCFRDSYPKSALLSAEMYIHHQLLRIYERHLDRLIAPSQFMKDTLVRFGWPADKIEVLYNFTDTNQVLESAKKPSASDYLLYFGRLSVEKGVDSLIRAWSSAKRSERLCLAGSGPQEQELRVLAGKYGPEAKIEFLGQLQGAALTKAIAGARAVIIPSIWYENMPLALLEALALGRPVIAANIGGLPEVVKEGDCGWLFEAGNASDLQAALDRSAQSDLDAYGERALKKAAAFNFPDHLAKLLEIYKNQLSPRKSGLK